MKSKALIRDNSVRNVNWFFFLTLAWSVFIQFLSTPTKYYQYLAFLIPISIYLFINRRYVGRILKPRPLNLRSIILIFLIWLASLPIIFFIVDLYIHFFGDTFADLVSQDVHDYFLINFFFAVITPSVLEEILLRGIILDGYRNKSRFVAALANGLMFGMLHLNSFQFFHTFVAGFIASFLVMATKSIFASILIHMINNGLPLVINHLYPPNPNIGYAASTNFVKLAFNALLGLIIIYILIRLLFKINKTPWKEKRILSRERVLNLPLVLSIFIFLGFSLLLILLLRSN